MENPGPKHRLDIITDHKPVEEEFHPSEPLEAQFENTPSLDSMEVTIAQQNAVESARGDVAAAFGEVHDPSQAEAQLQTEQKVELTDDEAMAALQQVGLSKPDSDNVLNALYYRFAATRPEMRRPKDEFISSLVNNFAGSAELSDQNRAELEGLVMGLYESANDKAKQPDEPSPAQSVEETESPQPEESARLKEAATQEQGQTKAEYDPVARQRVDAVVTELARLRGKVSTFSGDDRGNIGFDAAAKKIQGDAQGFAETLRGINRALGQPSPEISAAINRLDGLYVTGRTPIADVDVDLRSALNFLRQY